MRSQKKNVAMLCLFYFLSYVAFVLPYGYMQTFLAYVGYDVVECTASYHHAVFYRLSMR